MALIESLQQKAVEEGGADANECGDSSDSEENDGGLAKEEDDISLNEDEQASAEDKMECQIGNSDVNADGSVKTLAEIKEGDQQPKKHKGEAEEGKDATIMNKTSAAQVVDGLVEEDAVEEMKKISKEVDDNNESQQPQKRKGEDADIGADGTKRMKTSASMDETAV